ncbi:Diacylglycerol O-acyltransferase [Phytophthora palmivora]|uniref:Acyltransferase n=1 Tax=Phytophthora palmivora TaxID=4796 RepID=A0A2P4XVY3_9STRA|nr:Diacylglycerol O-acyltransferase [Phytophthora palmivora]
MAPDSKLQENKRLVGQDKNVFVYESQVFFSENSRVPKWMQNFVTDVFSFITAHYFIWSWPFLGLFYYLHKRGLDYISIAMVALYLPSFFSGAQKTGKGNVWDSLRTSSIWGLMNKFLRIKIIREQELDPKKQYIFGFHPHGIIVLSRLAIFGRNFDDIFPGIKNRRKITRSCVCLVLGASAMYYIPLGRDICLWLGGVDASRSTGEKVLKEGNSIIVYPGGVPEIFSTNPNSKETQLVLKKRLGFIKLAMRQGADLVPTFIFGEKWLYNMWTPPKCVTEFFRKLLGIPVLVFWGKFWWMPKAPAKGKRYGLVYGKPITPKHTPNPTDEEVRAIHAEYVAEIKRIFQQYKSEFGYEEDETLAII